MNTERIYSKPRLVNKQIRRVSHNTWSNYIENCVPQKKSLDGATQPTKYNHTFLEKETFPFEKKTDPIEPTTIAIPRVFVRSRLNFPEILNN